MYIIYDNEYPMCAYMSAQDIVGMAEDVIFPESLKEYGYSPAPGLAAQPNGEAQMLMAAQQVLEEHWGLFMYFADGDSADFVWYATEHNIEHQAKALIKLHDPELAAIEWGI